MSLVSRVSDLAAAIAARIKLIEQRPLLYATTTTTQNVTGQSYATLSVTAGTDTHSGFNSATKQYIVPQAGWYYVEGRARLADSILLGATFALGLDTVNQDSQYLKWNTSTAVVLGNRKNSVLNTRLMYLNKNDPLRMFLYVDSAGTFSVINAELSLIRLR